jgi:hypothetical protein
LDKIRSRLSIYPWFEPNSHSTNHGATSFFRCDVPSSSAA